MLAFFALPATLGLGVRHVAWEHCHFDEDLGKSARRLARRLDAHYCDHIGVLTERDRKRWLEALQPRSTVVRIPSTLPFAMPARPAPRTSKIVLAVERPVHEKGFDELLRAWSIVVQAPDWTLMIVGEGEERPALEAQRDQLGLRDSVLTPGIYPDVSKAYEQASIFCLSSRYDGFGLALIEAMAFGLPIASTTCETGPREPLEAGHDAMTVEAEDHHALAQALTGLILDADKANRLGQTAREQAQRISREQVTLRWQTLLDQKLQKSRWAAVHDTSHRMRMGLGRNGWERYRLSSAAHIHRPANGASATTSQPDHENSETCPDGPPASKPEDIAIRVKINDSVLSLLDSSLMSTTTESAPENPSSTAMASFFAKAAKLMPVTAAIGAVAALGFSYVQHPQWTAKMTVQIGQVTSVSANGAGTSKPIETQLTAADRYNLPSFRLGVLKAMGLQPPDANHEDSALIFDSMRATPSKSLDLVNVQVVAYSREQAISALNESFKALSAEHEKAYMPAVNRMKEDLTATTAKLTDVEQDYQRTYIALRAGAGQAAAQNLFATNILAQINAQELALGQQKQQLEDSLQGLRTYPTRVLGDYYAPEPPSSPGKALYAISGAAIGLLVGLLIALRRSVRQA